MNTSELDAVISREATSSALYSAAMACNTLAETCALSPHLLFVINTHDSGRLREHWSAIWFDDDSAIIFDLFGLPIMLYATIARADSMSAALFSSTRTLQNLKINFYGDYCI